MNKSMKICSTSYVISGLQKKIIIIMYHYTPIYLFQWLKYKIQTTHSTASVNAKR